MYKIARASENRKAHYQFYRYLLRIVLWLKLWSDGKLHTDQGTYTGNEVHMLRNWTDTNSETLYLYLHTWSRRVKQNQIFLTRVSMFSVTSTQCGEQAVFKAKQLSICRRRIKDVRLGANLKLIWCADVYLRIFWRRRI